MTEPRFRVPCGFRDYVWMFRRRDILADVRTGQPYDEIGHRHAVSAQRVGELAREEGLDRKARKLTQGVEAQVAACIRADDACFAAIGEAFDLKPRTVEAVAIRYGLRVRRTCKLTPQIWGVSAEARP